MRSTARVIAAAAILLTAGHAAAQTKTWTTTPDFNLGTLSGASDTKFADEVVLGPTPVSQTTNVWSDNFNYGLALRLNSVTGAQTGRYDSTLGTINGVATGARPAHEFCNWSNTGNCPGRVAVDTKTDVWIVNRAFGNQGTLTKISGDQTHAHCIDRNNNGVIDTSTDKNGDGIIDMNPAHGEYFGQNDECILNTIPIGANNAWPRSVAVDEYGKIWVGTFNEGKVYRYNPNDPVALELTVNVGGNPYSLASGGSYVFVSNASGQTARVQILTGAIDYAPCPGNYGIVADPGGQVAWLGSWMNQATGMYRADFSVTPHTCTLIGGGPGATTAITLDNEPAPGPYVWGANYSQEKVSKWTPAGVYVGSYPAGATGNAHGLCPDFQGKLWTVSDTAGTCPGPTCQMPLAALNPATGAILLSAFIGYLPADQATFPTNCSTGYCDGATPYLYSDFTGVQIDRQAPYTYLGTWDAVYDGGAQGIPWANVNWDATTPSQTTLTFAARAADTLAALPTASFVPVSSGTALAGITGEFIEISASLGGPGFVTPVLSDVTVVGPCAVVGNACCLHDSNCNDGNACHTGTCAKPGATCTFSETASCCLVNSDCNDSNACTTDSCPSAGGSCLNAPIAGCCQTAADCNDGDACTTDICSGPGGTCSHPLIAGCCLTNTDCTKGNACSSATCPTPGGFCAGGPIAGCCQQNSDCAVTDPCTTASCNLSNNTCDNAPITGCCSTAATCDDGDPCTTDSCTGPGGVCTHTPRASCCQTNTDCTGSNTTCTTYACSGPGGTCTKTTEPNCCMAAVDCDDGNLCTTDTCPTPGGACTHAPIAACCSAAADCDDGNRCTQDDCPTQGGACTHTALTGCCVSKSDCSAGVECISGWCGGVALVDAGLARDAGHDASSKKPDAGHDAGSKKRDAGHDASSKRRDGTTGADSGESAIALSGGCGCTVPGGKRPGGLATLAGLVALAFVGARRRRRTGNPRN